jgi:drug/metabolite transporter (DMT)-like permease
MYNNNYMSKALISILAGLGALFGWGTSDFFANIASDKVGNIKTFLWSQFLGMSFLVLVILFYQPVFDIPLNLFPHIIIAGLGFSFGYLFFYKAFEVGSVPVVSVVINLNSVLTMVVVYLTFGQRLTGYQIPGAVLILGGMMLTSVNFKELIKNKGLSFLAGAKESAIAAIGFGVFAWPFSEYVVERSNWMWTTFIMKVVAVLTVVIFAVLARKSIRVPSDKKINLYILFVGILEALAVLSLNYGFSVGDSILVAPIANSVALVTITLTAIFLKEKPSKIQIGGIILTALGIILSAF